ncbi:MAG: ATP-dependent Clp protease proteolytic subunit [Hyphomicrobium sp.]
MPSRQLNRWIWAAMAAVIAVFALQARDQFELMFAGVGRLDIRDEPERGAVVLHWRGRIEAPMAQRLSAAFDKLRDARTSFTLSLASPGGALEHGAEVVRLIQRMQETHMVDTLVEGRSVCASMCVPVYLQGRRRYASETARFMFHEVSFREFVSDEKVAVPQSAIGTATDQLFAKYFLPAGVSQTWLATIRTAISAGNDVWKSGRDLVDENAGIVQNLK